MDVARFGGLTWAPPRGPVEVTHDPADLDRGAWAVVVTFEGELTAVRMERREGAPPPGAADRWAPVTGWRAGLDRDGYVAGVREIRRRIAAGTVYQVNLTTVLTAPLPDEAHLPDLAALLEAAHPAPFAATLHLPSAGVDVVSASPERFLSRHGDRLVSSPIKGTAPTLPQMLGKDVAENVMITDLVRNDLQRVCRPGTVATPRLCAPQQVPGLVHLVSEVHGRLREGVGWADVLAATFPPGSVSGAPKSSALTTIGDLEEEPRGPYCGAVGWVDADADGGPRAELGVGIRTFWTSRTGQGRRLHFGAGAGITWGSDPEGEWRECELKAHRLVGLASGTLTP